MVGIHALSASLSLLLEEGMEHIEKELLKRSEYLFDRIQSVQGGELFTPTRPGRYAGIVTFRVKSLDPAFLYGKLSRHRIVCALRGGGIRFSPHFYTPYEHLDFAVDCATRDIEPV